MKNTLEQIKEEYATEQGRDSWEEFREYYIYWDQEILQEGIDQVAIRYASQFQDKLTSILHMSESKGVEGCTWGDTEMSSVDVAYGYNLALEYVKQSIGQLINKGKYNG